MAYAALISLKLSLNQIMMFSDQYSILHYQRKPIQSFLPKLEYLLQFLQDSSQKSNEKTCSLITRIRDAACEAQNIADLQCYETEMAIRRHVLEPKNVDLQHIIQEIDAIESDIREQRGSTTEEAMKIEHRLVPNDSQLQNSFRSGSSRLAPMKMMEGFKHHFMQIKEELMGQQSALAVVSIIGMGGIGKTTLATNIYNDTSVICHFDFRAWVVVSQSYFIRNILLGILDSMKMLSDEMNVKGETELNMLYQTLKKRRYLIIIDDIWDAAVWDEMRLVLPNDNNGSRILLTTRLGDVATYASSSCPRHHLSLLSRDESWILFCAKVFRGDDCPLELQEIGRKISERCGGLPLSLVVMGGLLSVINKTRRGMARC